MVLGIIVGLQVVTEVGPWLLGFGDRVVFDWSFWAITLRFLIVPIGAAVYAVNVVPSAVRFGYYTPIVWLQAAVAASLCFYPLIMLAVAFLATSLVARR